jgi:small subunit ribosomal protein S16e
LLYLFKLGLTKVNGAPIDIIEPATLRLKALEPLLLLGNKRTGRLDIRLKVRGGGSAA